MPILGISFTMAGTGWMLVAVSLYFLFVQRSIATVSAPAESHVQIE